MTLMNRRQLLTGAAALVGQAHLPRIFSKQAAALVGTPMNLAAIEKPRKILSSTYTIDMLSKKLVRFHDWHPYPKAGEREPWLSIPPDAAAQIVTQGEAILGTPWDSLPATVFLEFAQTGNRTHYQDLYFNRRQRIANLTLAECIEGKGRFTDEIMNGVWLTCEETFWGLPAHLYMQTAGPGLPDLSEPIVDLFAAQTSATLAWVHYLLGKQLEKSSPLITRRIEAEAKRRILDPAFSRDDFSWMRATTGHRLNNWNPWINSNWMLTVLLLEPDPKRRVLAVAKICKCLDDYIDDYSPDGGCEEGPGYWNESAGCYFDCLEVLASATDGSRTALTNPFVRKMMHYVADVHIADRFAVNYGDASARAGVNGELAYRMGVATGDRVLEEYGAYHVAPASHSHNEDAVHTGGQGDLSRPLANLMQLANARTAKATDALARDAWYPALHLMTARVKAGSNNGFYLAVQAAANQRSHGHNDSGSFIVFYDGKPVFIDVGVEAYTAKTFSAERYSIWTMQSAFHNLPMVGGVMQSSGRPYYGASEVHYASDDAHASLEMNLSTAYPPQSAITRWKRVVTLDRANDCIRLSEDFQLQRKLPVQLSFMTPCIPRIDANGSVLLSTEERSNKDIALQFDPRQVEATFERIPLQDEELRRTWGDAIYRILLASSNDCDSGQWEIAIA